MPKIYLSQAQKDADMKKQQPKQLVKGGKGNKGKGFVAAGRGGKGGKGGLKGGKGGKGGGAVRQNNFRNNQLRAAPYAQKQQKQQYQQKQQFQQKPQFQQKQQQQFQQQQQRGGGNNRTTQSMLSTAQAVASSTGHPKKKEVKELLTCHQKGWIDDQKFRTVLQSLLFK